MTLQERVNEYADANGVTREAMAAELGISRSSLFNKLGGSNEFTLFEAYKLSRMLGLTLDELYSLVTA